jgi:hypothetical protein
VSAGLGGVEAVNMRDVLVDCGTGTVGFMIFKLVFALTGSFGLAMYYCSITGFLCGCYWTTV